MINDQSVMVSTIGSALQTGASGVKIDLVLVKILHFEVSKESLMNDGNLHNVTRPSLHGDVRFLEYCSFSLQIQCSRATTRCGSELRKRCRNRLGFRQNRIFDM